MKAGTEDHTVFLVLTQPAWTSPANALADNVSKTDRTFWENQICGRCKRKGSLYRLPKQWYANGAIFEFCLQTEENNKDMLVEAAGVELLNVNRNSKRRREMPSTRRPAWGYAKVYRPRVRLRL
ncbi:MAG TPA: hypothetical protein VFE08_11505 [Candidatus Sulfotelmatobacter sp.]|jgi:hypothetical protein|nr:hypothetical protein [Candidatus Sulfotelmatobacter sp.]